jgi:hypothetical protein
MAALLAIITIITSMLAAVGYGMNLLDEKFLNWNLKANFHIGDGFLEMILLGSLLSCTILAVSIMGLSFIKGSKALGNQLFNNSAQTPE